MFRRRTIKAKILTALLLLSGLTFAAIGVLAFNNMQRLGRYTQRTISSLGRAAVFDSKEALRGQTQKELLSLAENQAFAIDLQLEKIMADVRMFAGLTSMMLQSDPPETEKTSRQIALEEPEQPEAFSAYLLAPAVEASQIEGELRRLSRMHSVFRLIKNHSRHLKLVFLGTQSGLFLKYPWTQSPEGYDPRKRTWYMRALETRDISWSPPYQAASYNCLVVSCSMPVVDDLQQIVGVAAVDVSVDSLASDFLLQQARWRGNAFLIDGRGNLIAGDVFTEENPAARQEIAWDETVQLQNLRESPLSAVRELGAFMIAAQKSGIYRYDIEGREFFVAYAPLRSLGGCVGINLPAAEIDAPIIMTEKTILNETEASRLYIEAFIEKLLLFFGIMVLLLLSIVIATGILLSRKITHPIVQLEKGAKQIGQGNLDFQFSLQSGDEIEALADTFNHMTEDLKHHIEALSQTVAAREKIESDLKVGREIQASMLPQAFPAFPGRREFDIYAEMKPAHEVAGDFYDYFFVDAHHLFFCIGDVSGKGVPAALFMAITKTLIKDDALRGFAPDSVLAHVNNALEPDNRSCMFATVFCGILDTRTGKVQYSNAGHNPPLLKSGKKGYSFLDAPKGFVVGPMSMPTDTWALSEMQLAAGDMLFLYSDGVTEAMNTEKQLFSAQRLQKELNRVTHDDVTRTVHRIKKAIKAHAEPEPQSDDVAIMVLKFNGADASDIPQR